LYAAVTGLAHSCTEGRTVEMLAAWVDDDEYLCFVYQYPYFVGVLGLRRSDEDDSDEPDSVADPRSFGQDIADFDIGEPLGTVVERLRVDAAGVHWWGDLDESLPSLPDSARLRQVIGGQWTVTGRTGRRGR
jgi:hypothetical protein